MNRIAIAGSIRLSLFLIQNEEWGFFDDFNAVLKRDATIENLIEIESDEAFDDGSFKSFRCQKIRRLCEGNELALCLLELAALRYVDERVSTIYSLITPGVDTGVNLELAIRIMDLPGGIAANTSMIIDAYEKLRIILLGYNDTADFARKLLHFDFRLAAYMDGEDYPDSEIIRNSNLYMPDEKLLVYAFDSELNSFEREVTGLYDYIYNHDAEIVDPVNIIIVGARQSGRTLFARAIAQKLNIPLITIDFDFLIRSDDPKSILNKVFRECILLDGALCIKSIYYKSDTEELIKEVRREYDIFGCRPLFYLCSESVKPLPYIEGTSLNFNIPKLDLGKRLSIFNSFREEIKIESDIDSAELISKMDLSAGQMKRVCQMIKTLEKSGERLATKDVYNICYKVLDDGRYAGIKRVNAGYNLDDLKVSDKNKVLLKDVCNQVSFKRKVFDDWGMNTKYAYGKCVSLLLAGPPGTGKTMAVHALASELGLELYKVDLSQVIDKYVGETQKRLEEIFDTAQRSNMILFFDEADAVLGKRSDAHDSHDKYSNAEIAFILQRMEEYDGIVALATNLIHNIDTAFMRRIRYVVNFDLPDAATRKEIWMSSISDNVPLSKDVDFDFLAEQFELAGGNIKNIVLNASFLAAADNSALDMEHIIRAIANDNSKDKRIAFTKDYGKYGYLVKD